MKPTTLIALFGLLSGTLIVLTLDLNWTLVFSLLGVMVILNFTIYFHKTAFIGFHRYSFIFSIFFLFSVLNTFSYQRLNNFQPILELSDEIILGEIIQVKTNEERFSTYQIRTHCYYKRNLQKKINTKLILICQSKTPIPNGHLVLFKATLKPFQNEVNPGSFDAISYYSHHNFSGMGFLNESCITDLGEAKSIGSYFNRWQAYLGTQIDSKFDNQTAGIAKALILGDKTSIDSEITSSFSNTGAMHILAVSGLHVGILLNILQFIFGRFYWLFSKRQSLFLALVSIWLFALLSGASPSVMRSTVMFTCLSLGQLLYRESSSLNNLFFSAILLLAYNPYFLFDIGFQLSYVALLGIFLFQQNIEALLTFSFKPLKWIWKGTSIGIAATLATTPLMLYYFHQFPNYFMLSNLIVMILGFALILVLTLFLFFHSVPFLNLIFAFIGSWLIYFLIISIQFIDQIPGAVSAGFQISLPLTLLCFGLVITWNLSRHSKIRYVQISVVLILFLLTSFNRNAVMQQNKITFINGTRLCMMIQASGTTFCLYDPSITANKLKRYLLNYTQFQGVPIEKTLAINGFTDVTIENHQLQIKQLKNGFRIKLDSVDYFYYTQLPNFKESHVILNNTLYQKFHGQQPTSNYTIAL